MSVKAQATHPEYMRTENTEFDRLNSVILSLAVLLHRVSRCACIFRQIAFDKRTLIELIQVTNLPLINEESHESVYYYHGTIVLNNDL